MADWAKNILQVDKEVKKSVVAAFFTSIASKGEFEGEETDLLIDFQKIVPVTSGDGESDWRKTRRDAWGTKACYYFGQRKLDENTIEFLTAWTGVPKLMRELSRQHPEIKLCYICELESRGRHSIGTFIFHGGEVLSDACYERGTESYEKYMKDLYNECDAMG